MRITNLTQAEKAFIELLKSSAPAAEYEAAQIAAAWTPAQRIKMAGILQAMALTLDTQDLVEAIRRQPHANN